MTETPKDQETELKDLKKELSRLRLEANLRKSLATQLEKQKKVAEDAKAEAQLKTQQMEDVSGQLAKYLSPQIYESIFSGKQNVEVKSYRKKITIFFSDIVNFTVISDKLESEELTALLNFYLNEMSKNNISFSVGFSEFFGSRNESELSFSNNKVSGKTFFVLDFDYASHIMVSNKDGRIGIVSLDSDGIEVVDLITVDRTRIFKEIILKNAEIDILENTKNSNEAVNNAIDAGRIIIAADSLGASKIMLEKAIEYSKERKQFNRAIGSFQAVKHMCAEMASELEPCFALLWHAAHSFDNNEENKKIMVCHAKSHISDISKMVSKKATEVHGGMGFTDLLGLHYWFKRIGVNRHILGTPEIVREEAASAQNL